MHQRQLFLQHVAQTSNAPLLLEIERADGCDLYDVQGKKYLDLISGIAVANIGHNHPAVVEAIVKQAQQYSHVMVYGEFMESPQVQYAHWLSRHLPANLNTVYFVNSGSEAVETALKLAKRATGRPNIVSFSRSYHGSTMGALSAGNSEERKNAFRPLVPGQTILPYNDVRALMAIDHLTAAVLIEQVQAEAGVVIPDPGYLDNVLKICRQVGALLIFDECQTGFGRTGSLFHFQQAGVVPDILILGKALGGGMPLGACIASHEMMQLFTHAPVLGHITTFGGHPVCCAAGLAAAGVLENAQLAQSVQEKANLFREHLQHAGILEWRNSGLMIALQLRDAETTIHAVRALLDRGVLTDWFLFAPDCLRLAPPLTISNDEIHFACKQICAVLDALK